MQTPEGNWIRGPEMTLLTSKVQQRVHVGFRMHLTSCKLQVEQKINTPGMFILLILWKTAVSKCFHPPVYSHFYIVHITKKTGGNARNEKKKLQHLKVITRCLNGKVEWSIKTKHKGNRFSKWIVTCIINCHSNCHEKITPDGNNRSVWTDETITLLKLIHKTNIHAIFPSRFLHLTGTLRFVLKWKIFIH